MYNIFVHQRKYRTLQNLSRDFNTIYVSVTPNLGVNCSINFSGLKRRQNRKSSLEITRRFLLQIFFNYFQFHLLFILTIPTIRYRTSNTSLLNCVTISLIFFYYRQAVPRIQYGKQREPSVKILRSPFSAEFWRHCVLRLNPAL